MKPGEIWVRKNFKEVLDINIIRLMKYLGDDNWRVADLDAYDDNEFTMTGSEIHEFFQKQSRPK